MKKDKSVAANSKKLNETHKNLLLNEEFVQKVFSEIPEQDKIIKDNDTNKYFTKRINSLSR